MSVEHLINRPLPAPAKLNLMLHITGRRADGYHLLQTVFQFVELCDQLTFTPRLDSKITCGNELPGLAMEDDLIYQAALLLQLHSGTRQGVDIKVEKNIPAGAGLGGGSSDAATVLMVLNRLWDLGLSKQKLAALGVSLGADIPVFIFARAAWAEGVGERLTALDLEEPWYLILTPDIEVSTAEIFAHADLTRDSAPIRISAFFRGAGHNDCYPIAAKLYPQIARLKDWLNQYGTVKLSGTGSSLFARFADEKSALEVKRQLPEGCRGFVTKATNSHPLLRCW